MTLWIIDLPFYIQIEKGKTNPHYLNTALQDQVPFHISFGLYDMI